MEKVSEEEKPMHAVPHPRANVASVHNPWATMAAQCLTMKGMQRLISGLVLVAALAAPALSSAATITHSLSVGSRGQEVITLQQTLIALGYLKVPASGYFGLLTKQALISYQKANGLDPVGSVGPKTRAILNMPPVNPAAQTPTTGTTSAPTTTLTASIPVTATSSAAPASTPASSTPSDPNAFTVSIVSPGTTLPRTALNTTLIIATSKNAMCRWGTLAGMSFTNMTAFQTSGGTTHSYYIPSLASGSLYVYYVKCQDSASNVISPETVVSFTVSS